MSAAASSGRACPPPRCHFIAHDLWDSLDWIMLARVEARGLTIDPDQIGFLFGDGLNEFVIRLTPQGIDTHAVRVRPDLQAERFFERRVQTPLGVTRAIEDAFKILSS